MPAPRLVALLAVLSLEACCIPGLGEPEREVLAERTIDCGGRAMHVRRVRAVTDPHAGLTAEVREVAFDDGAATEATAGQLGAWRATEELPEHVRSEGRAAEASAWLLALPAEADYRCAASHLADLEAVFDGAVAVFRGPAGELSPTFRATEGGTGVGVEVFPDGTLYLRVEQGGATSGSRLGRLVREADGRRVMLLAREPVFAIRELPADLREPEALVARVRDAQGRALLVRFPCAETRVVPLPELP